MPDSKNFVEIPSQSAIIVLASRAINDYERNGLMPILAVFQPITVPIPFCHP